MSGVWGLVQARMGSERLPGKALLPLAGRSIFDHIVDRLGRVRGLSGVVLATTRDPRNDALVRQARVRGVEIWREPGEDDIAGRLAHAADAVGADAVLKVNGDCPLIDPAVLQRLLAEFEAAGADYASNKFVWSYPKGLSVEVIGRGALRWCHERLTSAHDREYVADWIRSHPERFRVASIRSERDLGHLDWMIDTPEDLAYMSSIFEALYRPGECFGMIEVLAYLEGAAERA